jgi:hypothetical protein
MSLNVGELVAFLELDDKSFNKGLKTAVRSGEREMEGFEDEGKRSGKRTGDALGEAMETALKGATDGMFDDVLDDKGAGEDSGKETGRGWRKGFGDSIDKAGDLLDASTLYSARSDFERAGRELGDEVRDGVRRSANGDVRLDASSLYSSRPAFERAGRQLGESASQGVADGVDDGGGRMGDAMEGAVDEIPIIGGASFAGAGALIGAAIVAGVASGIEAGLEKERLTDLINARLGTVADGARDYGTLAGDLYAEGWGDSPARVAEALGEVSARLRGDELDDTALKDLASRTMALADVLDVDLNQAIEASGAMLESGLADTGIEAVDLLAAALQGLSATQKDEVLAASEEYSQFFAAVGIDGPKAMAMLKDAAKDGRYEIDKTGDSIGEFTKLNKDLSDEAKAAYETMGLDWQDMQSKITQGGPVAAGAFDQIVEALKGIEDPVARGQAALALFGTPLEDVAGNASQLDEFLNRLSTQGIPNATAAADELSTAYENTATDWEVTKRRIEKGWSDVMVSYSGAVSYMVNDKYRDKVHEGMSWTFDAIRLKVRGAMSDASAWFSNRMGSIRSTASVIGGVISSTLARVWSSISMGASMAAGWVAGRASAIASYIAGIPGRIGDLGSALYGAGRDLIAGMVRGVTSMAGDLVRRVKDTVSGAIDAAKGVLGINSPSKVFAEIGVNTMQGLDKGIQMQASDVRLGLGRVLGQLAEAGAAQLAAAGASSVGGSSSGNRGVLEQHLHFHGPVAGRSGERWVADTVASAQRKGIMSKPA